jgi:hypothetical protein
VRLQVAIFGNRLVDDGDKRVGEPGVEARGG